MLTINLTYREGENFKPPKERYLPNVWFRQDFKPDWFDDNVVQFIIRTIDKNEFRRMKDGEGDWQSNWVMYGPIGYVNPSRLSTGSRGLVLLYKTDRPVATRTLGDNCIALLPELGDKCDITVEFDCLRPIDISKSNSGVKLLQTGKIYKDNAELGNDMLKVVGGLYDWLQCDIKVF